MRCNIENRAETHFVAHSMYVILTGALPGNKKEPFFLLFEVTVVSHLSSAW